MNNENDITRMNLRVPNQLYDNMKILAKIERLKGYEYVNRLIEEDIEKNKGKIKEHLKI